jgi:hypothetical protein
MSFNIMDQFKLKSNASAIGAMARMLGENEKKTSAGIAGAIPTVLAGLLGADTESSGKALDQADPGLVSNIRGALGSSGRWALVKTGVWSLDSLIGGEKLSALVDAIADHSGLSAGDSKSLLGATAPLIFSNLAKQGQSKGLDGKGILALLASQKANISQAIPAGVAEALADSGLLDSIGGDDQASGRPVAVMSQPIAETAPRAVKPEPEREPEPVPQPAPVPEPESEPESAPEPPREKRSVLLALVLLALLAVAAWFAFV